MASSKYGSCLSESDSDCDTMALPRPEEVRRSFYTHAQGDTESLNTSNKRRISDQSFDDESSDNDNQKYQHAKIRRSISYSEDANTDSDTNAVSSFSTPYENAAPEDILKNSKAAKMMKSLGYKDGTGLGKDGSGRLHPVEAFNQSGRKGLGFQPHSKGQEYTGNAYDPELEIVCAEETPKWLKNRASDDEILDRDMMEEWITTGPLKRTIHDETNFCDPQVLADILSLKTSLDDIKLEQFLEIRSMCNPYEKIGGVIFMNRAAMKMANIDAVFDFMFTSPKTETGADMVNDDLLYFADVCAGPGGFTEYVLWRKKWAAKGFGFTLKGGNDFKIGDMLAASTDYFTPYYGECEDGDIFKPENLESLKSFVLENTDDRGVHFLMADGGFDVQGDENIQEIMSKQLYLCQCIAALSLVRTGGHFVVKLFDVFTEFSVGLIYLMYKSFKQICIHKPNTSRPANSERYLICKWKKASSDTIERHLFHVNEMICSNKHKDIRRLVPLDVLRNDTEFFTYVYDSNNNIGLNQKNSLLKIIGTHSKTIEFQETRHMEMKTKCLEYWKVPNTLRSKKRSAEGLEESKRTIQKLISEKVKGFNMENISNVVNSAIAMTFKTNNELQRYFADKKLPQSGWYFQYISEYSTDISDKWKNMENGKCFFFIGCGSSQVYRFTKVNWVVETSMKLPANTLIIGEKVKEYEKRGKTLINSRAIHIIDAYCLGGTPIFHEPLIERHKNIVKFCKAMNKDSTKESNFLPLRYKKLYKLDKIEQSFLNLEEKEFKTRSRDLAENVPNFNKKEIFFKPQQILLLKATNEPFTIEFSKSQRREYYFDRSTGHSTYEPTPDMICNTDKSYKTRMQVSVQSFMPRTSTM